MFKGRSYLIVVLALAAASWWRDSTIASVARYAAMAYIYIDLSLKARTGYLRRRPHWTRDSWRRYFTVCAMFVIALAICFGMAVAVDARLPIVGAANSTPRSIWVLVMMLFMAIGAWGLASAVSWLSEGDPSKQFTRFQRQRAR